MDSSLERNRPLFEKDLVRRPKAERLARAVAQPLQHLLDYRITDDDEIIFLQELLARQPVGVLVQPALPRKLK